jgi:hypothetical protein
MSRRLQVDFELVLRRYIETAAFIGRIKFRVSVRREGLPRGTR